MNLSVVNLSVDHREPLAPKKLSVDLAASSVSRSKEPHAKKPIEKRKKFVGKTLPQIRPSNGEIHRVRENNVLMARNRTTRTSVQFIVRRDLEVETHHDNDVRFNSRRR